MQLTKHIRLLTFSALISITALLNAQSTRYIVKGGTENGEFSGGVFMGWGYQITGTGSTSFYGGTDGITEVVWKDLVGITQTNDTLIKTDLSGWGNAGGLSNNQLKRLENGWIDYRVNNLYNKLEFGLSTSDVASLDSIQYAVRLDSGQIYVYNSGVLKGSFGSVAIDDSIRIERIGNILFYTKNQLALFKQEVNAKDSLRIDVAIFTPESTFTVRASFGLENFSLNTIGMDTLDLPDTLKYNIYGVNGVTGIHNSNTNIPFHPTGISSGVKTITTSFYGYSGSDSTQILFDINKFRIVSNVRFKFNDTINSLDSSLFVIDKNGALVLLNGTNSYEDQFSPYLNLVLDGGISMTPNNDGQYDTLLVESNIPLSSYYINVTDVAGDTLYESTNISLAWNAKEASGLLVPVGSYFYHITLNGKLTEGQFLVEY